jgi:hypothetical protein
MFVFFLTLLLTEDAHRRRQLKMPDRKIRENMSVKQMK